MELIIEVMQGQVRTREVGTRRERGPERFDFDDLRLKTIDVFVDRLVRDERATRKELATLGEHLYVGLLRESVRDFVDARLEDATESEKKVQLRLKFEHPERQSGNDLHSKLASLPWEYLYCPALDTFVVQKAHLVLSRYVPPNEALREIDVDDGDDELRIGVVFANPHDPDLGRIDAGERLAAVQSLDRREGIRVEQPDAATPQGLIKFLRRFQPQVLHFIGHGGVERGEEEGKIILLDEDGGSFGVPDYRLGDFFADAEHVPPVVLLDLPDPEGGARDLERNMARLGPRLIASGVPAVVAMQYPFPAKAAAKFSEGFYGALAEGEDIDIAVTSGRFSYQNAVAKATETRMLGTPVLYAQSHRAVKRAVAGRDEEPGVVLNQLPVRPQATPREADSKSEVDPRQDEQLKSVVQVDQAHASNGVARGEGLLNAARLTGRTTMSQMGLPNESRAIVWRWFSRLDSYFDETTTAGTLADFIRDEWVSKEADEKLRAVAEAMEATVRRGAA